MLQLQQNSVGRKYNLDRYEYNLEAAHMRRAQRVLGHKARFNNIGLMQRAFNDAVFSEEDLIEGSFTVTAIFKDFSTGRTASCPIEILVPKNSVYNSVNFADMFENFVDSVIQVQMKAEIENNLGYELTDDMVVYACRFLLFIELVHNKSF